MYTVLFYVYILCDVLKRVSCSCRPETNTTESTYIPYLDGYRDREVRTPEDITWVDIFRTVFALGKINIKVLAYNIKAVIEHTWHLDFGLYLPSDASSFWNITKYLKFLNRRK